jgi:hypothetical protein
MTLRTMKALATIVSSLLLSLPVCGSITINLSAADLATSTGALIPSGSGLVLLVADTANNSFGTPTADAFYSGDDLEVFRGTVNLDNGFFQAGIDLAFARANNPLILYWYPSLGQSAATPGAGTYYGAFRTDEVLDGSDIAWKVPAGDGSTVGLNFYTTSQGGSNPNSSGWATSITPVPEPATCGLMAALVCLAGAVVSKRVKRK